ncbi:unnamed protein product [Mytilus coruscus]|uniref:Integrase zinc-binding domain-containing protein n=1 Tax=Mytilus coruscus TaxID=42192 RepID=A0A6J8ARS4_MYTCO|nr:unnamed protein product [Mytilus coruscus]
MVKPKSVLQVASLIFSTVFSRQKSHIKNNILKHWDKLKDDEEAKLLFDKRPLFAFRRHKNLKETVTSATLAVPRADNNYKDIIDYLETGRLPKDKDKHRQVSVLQPFYFLHDDILYHVDKRSKRGQRDLNANIQLAIPRKLVLTNLAETHNSLFSGHLGVSRTIRRTQRLYFWPLMISDIENWIKSCELCSERKQPPNPVRAQLSSMPIASMPFERVSTDIMGPLPVSGPSKYQYVLVFICYFTKYVEFIPLSDIRASTVA